MTVETISLKNHFLIAMPNLADPNFFHSVTYICTHNAEGAMGIVINRPMELSVSALLSHLEIVPTQPDTANDPVLAGGPVQQDRGFVIHRPWGCWQSSLQSSETVAVTTSRDILESIAAGAGPNDALIALGYAGWGAGQLEEELTNNTWLSCPAEESILFATPHTQRWQAAAHLIGVDLSKLSRDVGHA